MAQLGKKELKDLSHYIQMISDNRNGGVECSGSFNEKFSEKEFLSEKEIPSSSNQSPTTLYMEQDFPKIGHKPGTECVVIEGVGNDRYNASSVPIYQSATFRQDSLDSFGEYDYTRSGNPTRSSLGKLFFVRKIF